ncbi:MAG: cytochrome-c oxidase, cbb3-type subunit I [candidate division Zixibacteria bacterium]|nr:cytochrome-c oxidase, cbb3-type subunit I [candidate division Zixibacteria bacterium]
MAIESFKYDNTIVRNFTIATIFWGVVGMSVGLLAATQFFLPQLNFGFGPTTFSHIRPLHTNAVIFAFVGNAIFAGVYYSLQRLCKARMYSDLLSKINFWGWQLIIVSAALTFPAGITTGKEYAELEWPIDIAITVIWVIFGWNLFGTIIRRRERHMYVAIWFYIATFITVAILHVVNSIELPVTLWKSYPVYAGVQDALVQWWYGHNAVAFFLTTPYLGLMYYFLPKAANRPIFSYRLSIIHFWSLIFIYIWAGPHHLLYTALPDWAQSLGTVFSLMLLAPSWGGMLNGLLTLRGAWDKVRDDPTLKFLVVAGLAYGMATFEGPTLAIKSVNAISHYTDWTIAHVHVGALGWNGFLTFGMLYWLVPRLYGTALWSKKLAEYHFWIGFLGILVYVLPMYFAGVTQSLMLKQFTPEGVLQHPNFLETVLQIQPLHVIRAAGGLLYLTGMVMCVINLTRTMKQGRLIREEAAEAPALDDRPPHKEHDSSKHRVIERKPILFLIIAAVVVAIGGLVEIIPTFLVKSNVPTLASVKPYTPLELEGRDVYVAEGCYSCHSQMVRPFRSETERYGEYSKAGEFVYDHPFQWGSKRTGPDLHRVGGKYPDAWHWNHMIDPTSMSPGSIMPRFLWLAHEPVDAGNTPAKIRAMRKMGVPYPDGYDTLAAADMERQAHVIITGLGEAGITADPRSKLVALIAYLQRLGTDIKVVDSTGGK